MPQQTLEEAVAACTTPSEIWQCWSRWPDASSADISVVARAARFWDEGLAWHVVFGSRKPTIALQNPTWPAWADTFIAGRAAGLMSASRNKAVEVTDVWTAQQVLSLLVESGRVGEDSDAFQRLLALLDGRARSLTERRRLVVGILASAPNLSREAFEHLFTVTRRGNALGQTGVSRLYQSAYMQEQHWAIMLSDAPDAVPGLVHDRKGLPAIVREAFLEKLHGEHESRAFQYLWPLLHDPVVMAQPDLTLRIGQMHIVATCRVIVSARFDGWATLPEELKVLIRQKSVSGQLPGRPSLAERLAVLEPDLTERPEEPPSPVRARAPRT